MLKMTNYTAYTAVTILGVMALTFTACGDSKEGKSKEESKETSAALGPIHYDQATPQKAEASQQKKVTRAYATVVAKGDSEVVGAVTFREVEEGILVIADIGGLTPGKHGFHIHEHGDCSAHDGSSAGGHFNPTNKKHGGPDSAERHVGDLGNLEANQVGYAHYERIDKQISLNGEYSIIGKSVVIHEGEDDLTTDPTGNSGARIGCGAIKAFD